MSGFDRPAVAETHVSFIFFVGDRAYKVKKAVNPGFLDFSSLEKRKAACEREIELNRRFAADVYHGVATVLGTDGQPCEYVVVMTRMDPDRRLSKLVSSEEGAGDCLRAVAETIARFHREAPSGQVIAEAGTLERVRGRWQDNFDEMDGFRDRSFPSRQLDSVRDLLDCYLAGRGRLFAGRVAGERIRDCHADLLADDIYCYPDEPRILDCIEFDDQLRYIDVVDDAAFLAMDLERLAGWGPAERFLADYETCTPDDRFPRSLVEHYIAYRALVRCKVACIRHDQGDEEAGEQARRLMELCESHLRKAQVPLVLVGGLPGTGKSTLAAALGEELGWTVVRSDGVREELFGPGTGEGGFGEGRYSDESKLKVYEEMGERARDLLERGEPVILDASFSSRNYRGAIAEAAKTSYSPLVQLRCVVPREVAAKRMEARLAEGRDASEATPAIAAALEARADDWPEAVAVSTEGGIEESVKAARHALERP